MENFAKALAKKDYEAACSYTDRRPNFSAITQAARDLPTTDPRFGPAIAILENDAQQEGCPAFLRMAVVLDPDRAQQLAAETYEDIDIAADGETATVSGSDGEWKLRQSSDAWKIDDLTPLVSP